MQLIDHAANRPHSQQIPWLYLGYMHTGYMHFTHPKSIVEFLNMHFTHRKSIVEFLNIHFTHPKSIVEFLNMHFTHPKSIVEFLNMHFTHPKSIVQFLNMHFTHPKLISVYKHYRSSILHYTQMSCIILFTQKGFNPNNNSKHLKQHTRDFPNHLQIGRVGQYQHWTFHSVYTIR